MSALSADVYGGASDDDSKVAAVVADDDCDLWKQLQVANLLQKFQKVPFAVDDSGTNWFLEGYKEAAAVDVRCLRFAARHIGTGSTDPNLIGRELRRVMETSRMDCIIHVPTDEQMFGEDLHMCTITDSTAAPDLGISQDVYKKVLARLGLAIGKKVALFNNVFKKHVWERALEPANSGRCKHLQSVVCEIDAENEHCLLKTGLICLDKKTWIKDKARKQCSHAACDVKFSLTERKHHCRFCRDIFCEEHCSKKVWDQLPLGIILDDDTTLKRVTRFSFPEKKELRVCPLCDSKYAYFTEYYKYSVYADMCRDSAL